jgi:aconitate hydratase 2/2-methylisocitrate dehydratase
VLASLAGTVSSRLWIAPPTRMDETQLRREGYYATFAAVGARTERPGCSLCMGNQARVGDGATVFSTSTRNFPNRMGRGADVFLGSAELAAVVAATGEMPTPADYFDRLSSIDTMRSEIYRYLEFDRSPAPLAG